jgi:hypothetical protein
MRATIEAQLGAKLDAKLVHELLEAHSEAKRNYYLGGLRLSAVEGGRFCEAAFRLLEYATKNKKFTPLSKPLISTDKLIVELSNLEGSQFSDALHFAAFRLLMENGFIVEARTLVRSCYENLFWLGGLKDKGTDFLDQMEGEDTRGRRALSGELLKWWKDREGFEDTSNKLEEFIETLKAKPTAKILNEQVAKDAGLGAAYTMYRVLSNDSAHPSARSLSRHLQIDPDGLRTVCGDSLWSEEAEDLDTWSLGCGVLLMVCVATNEVLGCDKSKKLSSLYEQLMALRGSTKA